MSYTPPKRRRYQGAITNTDRWQQFQEEPGDVFICTPPKCGTTWTVTIVTMLAQGRTDVAPQKLVQWVDAEVIPINDTVGALAAQTHRRCIKSHTPFDGAPGIQMLSAERVSGTCVSNLRHRTLDSCSSNAAMSNSHTG